MFNRLGDSTLGTVGSWLNGLARRQQAIGDNIANIDTPGYRRKEAAFEVELQRQVGATSGRLTVTDPRHIAASSRVGGQGLESVQQLTSSRLDGNDVDIDQEMVSLAETQLRYQAASSILNTEVSTLRRVING